VPEWLKGHAWKACVPVPGTEGSNPSLSALPKRTRFPEADGVRAASFPRFRPPRPLRMPESMTGFGRGSASAEGHEVSVEVRSVNGRFIEVAVRAPRALADREAEVQALTRAALERGKVSVTVQAERAAHVAPLRVDEDAARAYAALLNRLRWATEVQAPVTLDHLLQFKEVFTAAEAPEDASALWAATEAALRDALAACRAMRRQEGAALAQDLHARLDAIEAELSAVEAAAPARIGAHLDALRQRLAALLDGETRVDPDRLALEVALLADRLDVTEECVRLRSHLAQFRETLDAEGGVGRRLNFLAQELNREVNTISSKANDPGIAHRTVTMKEELEKIREQVQNVV
jgi:uncharacterized protein (TIGR00255 family)